MGNFFQRQAMAVPADLNDPLLKEWVKPVTNPFLVQVPPGGAAGGQAACTLHQQAAAGSSSELVAACMLTYSNWSSWLPKTP